MDDFDEQRRFAVFHIDRQEAVANNGTTPSARISGKPSVPGAPDVNSGLDDSNRKESLSGLSDPAIDESRKESDSSLLSWGSATSESRETGTRNLFVSGLTGNFMDGDLRKLCEQYGKVLSAKVMLNIHTGENRGFGFVLFEDAESAARAYQDLNNTSLKGIPLRVAYSDHRGENLLVESNKLYVRNVPSAQNLPAAQLIEYFQRFGKVLSIQNKTVRTGSSQPIVLNPTVQAVNEAAFVPAVAGGGSMLRVLFIEYDTCESAQRCVDETHNSTPFPGCTVPMLAKIYEPQDLRVRRLQTNVRRSPNSTTMTPNTTPQLMPVQREGQHTLTQPLSASPYVSPFGTPTVQVLAPIQQPTQLPLHTQTQAPAPLQAVGHPLTYPSATQFIPLTMQTISPSPQQPYHLSSTIPSFQPVLSPPVQQHVISGSIPPHGIPSGVPMQQYPIVTHAPMAQVPQQHSMTMISMYPPHQQVQGYMVAPSQQQTHMIVFPPR